MKADGWPKQGNQGFDGNPNAPRPENPEPIEEPPRIPPEVPEPDGEPPHEVPEPHAPIQEPPAGDPKPMTTGWQARSVEPYGREPILLMVSR